jgi:hypothetical protein
MLSELLLVKVFRVIALPSPATIESDEYLKIPSVLLQDVAAEIVTKAPRYIAAIFSTRLPSQ